MRSAHQLHRHNATPPSVRAPATPPRHFSTPPPPQASSFDYYTPIEAARMRHSPPLNPWNPYFRNYGRIYPYNVSLNQYESAPQNYVVVRESSSQQPTNYATRIHLVAPPASSPPPPPPAPPPPQQQQHQFCGEFNRTVLNPLPMGESMRRTLARPRSNHTRSFHHYRHGEEDDDISSSYSSLPVIEISSEEEENGDMTPLFVRRHSEHTRPSRCNRTSSTNSNNTIRHIRSPSGRIQTEPKPNIQPPHLRTASAQDSGGSVRYPADESLALSCGNRMKRPHHFSSHSPSKVYRRSNGCRRTDSNYTSENTSPYNNDEFENGRSRPRLCLNERNISAEPTASTSNRANNADDSHYSPHHNHYHHHDGTNNCNNINNNTDGSNNEQTEQKEQTESKEQKFKIRIKREFKIEPNDRSEINENIDSESVVVDTKAPLQPLIAHIKEE